MIRHGLIGFAAAIVVVASVVPDAAITGNFQQPNAYSWVTEFNAVPISRQSCNQHAGSTSVSIRIK
jgi:hypothetical protein